MSDRPSLWERRLPNGKPISALGFGCSSIWAKPSFDADDAHRILEAALAEGINHFDTSPSYGPATGETRLGDFLRDKDSADLVISTKVGTNLIDARIVRSFDPEVMRHSFQGSLERLGTDRVDILYLHGPGVADLEQPVFDFFEALKREGRITYSGVNSFDPAVLDRVTVTPIDAVMLQYNVADHSLAPQLKRLAAAGKIVISGTAVARAKFDLRTFIPRDRTSLWYLARMVRKEPMFWLSALALARRLCAIDRDPYAAAIRFVTAEPLIVSNLFGSSRLENVVANARAGKRAPSAEASRAIDALREARTD